MGRREKKSGYSLDIIYCASKLGSGRAVYLVLVRSHEDAPSSKGYCVQFALVAF